MENSPSAEFLTGKIHGLKVAVIGDVMLDRYFYGQVKRISPEAPVPVNKVNKITSVLGGAGNVAANLALLGCKVFLGGVTGRDANRTILEEKLRDIKIDCSGLMASADRETITKLRIIGSRQQMLRLDFEEVGDLTPQEVEFEWKWFQDLLHQGLDGVIVSDYAKGVCSADFCQKVIAEARKAQVPILVDPKGSDWSKYAGCSFITPNLKEMCEAGGRVVPNEDKPIVELAREAGKTFNIDNVVVTRSEKGVTLVHKDVVLNEPATAQEVFDVSGAGDTVAAVLLAAIAGGLSKDEALLLSNKAAGIVVSKVGTYPVHREELLKEILTESRKTGGGYRPLSWEELFSLVKVWKAAGEKIVFTNGCFDILHTGHVTYLEEAASLGKHLIVGVNTDASVKRLKGETRPLVNEQDRARILAALGCVDAVVLFDEDTPGKLIAGVKPDILVKGGDYKVEDVVGRENAGEVQILPFEEGYSTTGIIEKVVALVKEGKL